jgi:sulfide:quinone oxidoreductase
MATNSRVIVLGAGFGGLELTTMLSEALGEAGDITLIDRSDHFMFGFSKLDVMFGIEEPEAVRLPYRAYAKPGVRLVRETVTAIDPEARTVTTDLGTHQAQAIVVALGSEYDMEGTPGLLEGGNEFYSGAGAERLRGILPTFGSGHALIAVCDAPYKCPPAPSEAALMLHDHLTRRGVREKCSITLSLPFQNPVPPSPEASRALIEAFAERGIRFVPGRKMRSVDPGRRVAVFDDDSEIGFDLLLAVPRQRATAAVRESGLAEDGYIPVDPATLATRFPGVYALGDVATQGTPKAGVFAEGAARVVATALIAEIRGSGEVSPHLGRGSCYIEFGAGRIGRVDIDFLSGEGPTGAFQSPSTALRSDKRHFGASRRSRWFDSVADTSAEHGTGAAG